MDTGTGSLTHNSFVLRILSFVEEMGRRRVWRTALAYGAVVFVLLQVGEIVLPAFRAPDWALKVLVVSSLLGFPVVLALAWVFDITSQGIRITRKAESEESTSYGVTFPRLALLAVTLSCVGGLGWWTVRDTILNDPSVAGAAPQGSLIPAGLAEEAVTVRSLAVLPLDDFSEEEGGVYFTAGLHEELVSQISQRTAARVVSRTSVVQYDRSGKAMPAIARELGVDAVVEGSVFRSGNRVRITVQLIHGPSDTHLWAESYEGTTDDAISLQRDVAQAIATAIQSELFGEDTPSEPSSKLASNPRAQDEYLKGRYDQAKGTREGLTSAIQHYHKAVEEDSSFAAAFAGLAGAQILLEMQSHDLPSPEGLVDGVVLQSLEQAFSLDQNSPEAQAVVITMREAMGPAIPEEFYGGVSVVLDSGAVLEPAVARETTEFGRQLHRVVAESNRTLDMARDPSFRVAGARRLASASHFREAEASLQGILMEQPETVEAWDALEQLKIQREDYQGALEVRKDRLAQMHGDSAASSIRELEEVLSREGASGYWSWRITELEERVAAGEDISRVEMARALVGVQRQDEAFPYLETALEEHDRNLLSLWTDPGWDAVRNDPRFREILEELRSHGGGKGFPRPEWPRP